MEGSIREHLLNNVFFSHMYFNYLLLFTLPWRFRAIYITQHSITIISEVLDHNNHNFIDKYISKVSLRPDY